MAGTATPQDRTNLVDGFPTPTPNPSTVAPTSLITAPPSGPSLAEREYPVSATCPPNELVVQITTAVIVPDFSQYYPQPIQSFRPTYKAFADGSLIAPPYLKEIQQANWTLLFVGACLMLFVRNSIVSADYIRRGRVKYKGLFYALLISQLFGVLAFVTQAWSFIGSHVNCRAVFIVQAMTTELSASILLSGILGIKAYRCLDNSKIILFIVGLPQLVSSSFIIVDLVRVQAIRKLSRECIPITPPKFTSMGMAIRFGISLFIWFCFVYALWKSLKLPSAHGRISLCISERPSQDRPSSGENLAIPPSAIPELPPLVTRPRGWWDYVPEPQPNADDTASSYMEDSGRGLWSRILSRIRTMFGIRDSPTYEDEKRILPPSQRTDATDRMSSKRSTVRFSDTGVPRAGENIRPVSPAPSGVKSLRRLISQMGLVREVMRNELASTALTASYNVVAATLGLVGSFAHIPIPPPFFIGAHWATLSLLVIHSFGRVVERHEREAVMQNPSSWDPLYKVEQATNGARVTPRALSSISVASNPRRQRFPDPDIVDHHTERMTIRSGNMSEAEMQNRRPSEDNPFEDFRFTGPPLPAEDERLRRRSETSTAGDVGLSNFLRIGFDRTRSSPVPPAPSFRIGSHRESGTVPVPAIEIASPSSRNSDLSRNSYFHYDRG